VEAQARRRGAEPSARSRAMAMLQGLQDHLRLFDRTLQQVLQRKGWEIVQLSQATTRPAGPVHAPPHRPGPCESTALVDARQRSSFEGRA
jgi:hypothetical protein